MKLMRLMKNLKRLMKIWDDLKIWNDLDDLKKKVGIVAFLLLLPASLVLHPVSAFQKVLKPGKTEVQAVNNDPETKESPGINDEPEAGPNYLPEFQFNDRQRSVNVSRSGVDRESVYLLAQVIEGEAADEPYEGKVAVGAVIVNRTESDDFPNTIPGVVYETYAFESVSNGQYKRPLSEESLQAAVAALDGQDPTGDCLYFWNPATATSPWVWSRPIVTQIGRHVFAR
jgi:N-acetylmuramoyl-L-alanine amidase